MEASLDTVKALAEPLRWRIVELLGTEELCVCHLVEELDVDSERFRYWTYYRLRTEALADLGRALGRVAEHAPTRSERRRPCC